MSYFIAEREDLTEFLSTDKKWRIYWGVKDKSPSTGERGWVLAATDRSVREPRYTFDQAMDRAEALTDKRPRDITYTDAPAAYDYTGFGAREEEIVGKTKQGREVRKVSTVQGFYTDNQRMRYGSGCYFACTQGRWDEIKDLILAVEVVS